MKKISRKAVIIKISAPIILAVIITIIFFDNPIKQFGYLKLEDEMPFTEGYNTFAPIYKVPKSKFYIAIGEPELWCIQEDCGDIGMYVKNLGGWLEGGDVSQVTIDEIFGLDAEENKNVKKIILVGDGDSKLVGIYPNKGIDDVEEILKLH